jgi:hypothetical protein
VVDVLAEGPASQAGPELIRFSNIVAFDSQNPIVFYVQLKGASPPAIEGGSGADDLNIPVGLADILIVHFSLRLRKLYFMCLL